jgi:Na+-driven multidrug efflux pump
LLGHYDQSIERQAILKTILPHHLAVMVQTIVSFVVTFIDNIMVGGVSNEAVSAVYAVNQIRFCSSWSPMAFSAGGRLRPAF